MIRVLTSKSFPKGLQDCKLSPGISLNKPAQNVQAVLLQQKSHPFSETYDGQLQGRIFDVQNAFGHWQRKPVPLGH
jgi:hypothetical protein